MVSPHKGPVKWEHFQVMMTSWMLEISNKTATPPWCSLYWYKCYPTLTRELQGYRCEENLYFKRWNSWTHPPIWPIRSKYVTFICVDLRKCTKTIRSHGDSQGQIADFQDNFERIKWLYLHFKCGISTRSHFEWVVWHWSSLCQLNLEPTRRHGLQSTNWPRGDQCQRSHAHGFLLLWSILPCRPSPQRGSPDPAAEWGAHCEHSSYSARPARSAPYNEGSISPGVRPERPEMRKVNASNIQLILCVICMQVNQYSYTEI